jgi:hypothetical protein
MNFSFGIITGGYNDDMLRIVVNSIRELNIENYEIIIVGNTNIKADINIPFDENIKPSWITKKKNIITNIANYENIVYLHDYIVFDKNWYAGYLSYGDNFSVCMNRIENLNGDRFRDWCVWEPSRLGNTGPGIISYDIDDISKHMYISGSYWVAKKSVMLEYPLDENLSWGYGEDVIWSKQVTAKYNFSMNTNSKVSLLKQKDLCVRDYRTNVW